MAALVMAHFERVRSWETRAFLNAVPICYPHFLVSFDANAQFPVCHKSKRLLNINHLSALDSEVET
jgi:hypothetical protein